MFLHKEFITSAVPLKADHEIHPITRAYPQYHRIVLRSVDKDAGSTNINARFSGVTLNERFTAPAILQVNSFTIQNSDSGALTNAVIEVRLGGILHPRSFDSSNKTATDLLCVANGYNYYNQSPSADAIGLPITDPNQFQHANLNVYLRSTDNTTLTVAGNWTLVIDIVNYDTSIPY